MLDSVSHQEERVPAQLRERYASIIALTDTVCRERLTEEYAELCRRMAAALCRKRPSPVVGGQPASWACGIAHAIGSVNFLFDKTQKPHLTAQELCELFGVSQSNAAAKASQIRKLFALFPCQPEWSLPSRSDDDPLLWILSIDGIMVDVRTAPLELQELAVAQGLIPHLPGASRRLAQ